MEDQIPLQQLLNTPPTQRQNKTTNPLPNQATNTSFQPFNPNPSFQQASFQQQGYHQHGYSSPYFYPGFSQPSYPHFFPTQSSQCGSEPTSPPFQYQVFGSTQSSFTSTPSSHSDYNLTPTLDKQKKGKKVASHKAMKTKTKVRWDDADEVLLARAHVHISVDSIKGNNQKVDNFWARIHAYWIKEALVPREQSVIKSHWHMMAKHVHCFAELYNNIKAQYHRGWSDDQVRNAAKTKYHQSENTKFPYEHVWEVVRCQPKWNNPVFNDVLEGTAPPCNFIVNDNEYTTGYYLADGIYPEWSTLVKTFTYPQNQKMLDFKARHESARKDVERAFGVLQARWHIIKGPVRIWSMEFIKDIMYACVILHNMIVEDEGAAITDWSNEDDEPPEPPFHGPTSNFQAHMERYRGLHNNEAHHALRNDLMEHLWAVKNNNS